MYQQYFYDGQIRRFLTQFIRAVSNFQWQYNANGVNTLQRVPVYYGDSSRQVSAILKNNSENALNAVPAFAAYISALQYDQSRLQDPTFVSKMSLRERAYDATTDSYTSTQGAAYTVERLMPIPYKLGIKLDLWTSNTDQKLQIIEQVSQLFNPSLEIQSTDNYIDWTSLSYIQLLDTTWSSRSVPIMSEEPIDIATFTFEIPIWISPPVKVKKLGVVQKIVSTMYDSRGNVDTDNIISNPTLSQQSYTPLDYGLLYIGNQLTLLSNDQVVDPVTKTAKIGGPVNWRDLLSVYGNVVVGSTEIRLALDTGTELIGQIANHPYDPTIMLYSPIEDTLPGNTIPPLSAIINPENVEVNSDILTPATGTRYLILKDVGSYINQNPAPAWGFLVAHANDIIQWDGTKWVVSFDSNNHGNVEYVTNNTTNTQYRWTGTQWVKSVEGHYKGGDWSIVI
jgi:hypothetical protein